MPPVRKKVVKSAAAAAQTPVVVPEFVEIDFGRFEGRTHDELMRDEPAYAAWLTSGGLSEVPGGETQAQLCARCRRGFLNKQKPVGFSVAYDVGNVW